MIERQTLESQIQGKRKSSCLPNDLLLDLKITIVDRETASLEVAEEISRTKRDYGLLQVRHTNTDKF